MIKLLNSRQLGNVIPHYRYDRAQLVVFTGRRGMGKTTGIKSYISVREPRLLLIDHYDDFPDVELSPSLDAALSDLAQGEPCRRRIFPDVGAEDLHAWADEFFIRCYDQLRDTLVVGNEITLLSKPTASPMFTVFITQGRRRGLRFACDAQRIHQVPYVVQSECTELLIFKVTRPRDIGAIEDWASPEIAQKAPTLAVGQCMLVDL